ncbi:MAG: HD domain-containing protein [Pyrinomonadaceae bacterium]
MEKEKRKIGLRYVVLLTLLLVGVVPLLITGWFLSDRSGRELRSAEGRYQTELVRDKANRIEIFGRKYVRLVSGYRELFEFVDTKESLLSVRTQEKIASNVRSDENLLALFVKPVQGESLSAFRSETINQQEIEKISGEVLSQLEDKEAVVGEPEVIKRNGELVLAIASPIVIEGQIAGAAVAIASLQGLSKAISDEPMSEAELWESGSPLIFVVDEQGRAIFHPNSARVTSREPLKELKIVQEWAATKNQIQSALLPFTTEYKGETKKMIGAYSTAVISENLKFGVIVMQDEERALVSVAEMRRQTWLISGILALVTLILGTILARQLTSPLLRLVSAAQTISSGDFSHRIETRSITEIGTLGTAFNSMTENLEDHIARLAQAAKENRELFVGTVKALAAAIDGKDHYTRGHSERVSRVSVAIGQRLNLGEDELETLRISALLHDVGKIGIDDAILKKPSTLTEEEYAIMKTHPQEGYKIMKNIPAMAEFLPGMYMHHEMVNGMGYPQGLSDDEIPLQAKIVSVADTFDAMTIDRPYQKGMELPEAIERIKSFVGTRYDIHVVNALIEACADGQIGVGRVKLNNHKPARKTPEADESAKTAA